MVSFKTILLVAALPLIPQTPATEAAPAASIVHAAPPSVTSGCSTRITTGGIMTGATAPANDGRAECIPSIEAGARMARAAAVTEPVESDLSGCERGAAHDDLTEVYPASAPQGVQAISARSQASEGCEYNVCTICGGNPIGVRDVLDCHCGFPRTGRPGSPGRCEVCVRQLGVSCALSAIMDGGDDWWR